MVTITERAAQKVRAFIQEHGQARLADHGLRVRFVGGGCDGFLHELELDSTPGRDDVTFEVRGIKIFVDRSSLSMVEHIEVDYVQTADGEGFTVRCPGSPEACGCGRSFPT